MFNLAILFQHLYESDLTMHNIQKITSTSLRINKNKNLLYLQTNTVHLHINLWIISTPPLQVFYRQTPTITITFISIVIKYRVSQILCAATEGCRSWPGFLVGWLPGLHADTAPKHQFCYFSSLSEEMVMRIDVHLQSGNVSIYWLWLLLDVSAVSIVIVIIAICDMPRQEFSLQVSSKVSTTTCA